MPATSSAGRTAPWRCAGAPWGMVEAAKQFRRVNGYLHLPALRAALEAEVAKTVTKSCEDQEELVSCA
jgi:hypothetical protein